MKVKVIKIIKEVITLFSFISICASCAILIYSNVHWHFLNNLNLKLKLQLQDTHIELIKLAKKYNHSHEDRKWLTKQVWILSGGENHLKYRTQLKKLIKERNIKYGIGGD